ncbi:MAG: hypothetical protein ABIG43_00190 [Chloroflexota bacterium]
MKKLLLVLIVVSMGFSLGTLVLAQEFPEIQFVDGVPILPYARPVVIVSGSDYEMGFQYARQLSEIFGNWLLEIVPRRFTAEQLNALKTYQAYILKFAPEMIDFFKGMAAGATEVGVPLTYEEVLAQFASTVMHDEAFPVDVESNALPPDDRCSSFAAWGTATHDGSLIASGSSDGSDYFAVTLVFLPNDGNSFIWMIYEAVDTYLGIGGQPALNDKGLVYVHHGATQNADKMGRPIRYGLQSGTAIWHTLRYASNAKEAVDLHLSYDCTGWGWYGTGGFWADTQGNAFVIERMEDPVFVRKAGDFGEQDFLYATNNLLSRDLGREGEVYIDHGGWTASEGPFNSSVTRNLQLWHMLNDYHGKVDLTFAKMMWRYNTSIPVEATPDTWDKIAATHYKDNNGAGWGYTIGRDTNADIGIVLANELLYYVSTGYAQQISPNTGDPNSMHGQRYLPFATRAFYQLKLTPTAQGVAAAAKHQAEINLFFANKELRELTYFNSAYAPLDDLYNQALIEWTKGDHYEIMGAADASDSNNIYWWAKATRAFTRCQVLALKVYNALIPPATTPENLGLAPYEYKPGE